MHELSSDALTQVTGGLSDPSGEWGSGEIGYDLGCVGANIMGHSKWFKKLNHWKKGRDICDG